MASPDINLLQTKTDFNPIIAFLERYIRTISVGIAAFVISVGMLLGLAFFLLTQKQVALTAERQQALARIESNLSKESLLFLLRERLNAIATVIGTQKSFAPFIDTTLAIVQSYTLTSFALGENNVVNVTLTVQSLSDAVNVLSTVITMDRNRLITNPILQSFTMDSDGNFEMSLSYTVVL